MANRLITQIESQNALLGAVVANFMLNKRDRIIEHKDADEVTVKGSNRIPLLINEKWFYIDTDTDLSTGADLDALQAEHPGVDIVGAWSFSGPANGSATLVVLTLYDNL